MTVEYAMAVHAVSGPRWHELLIVRGSGRVRTGAAQFRRPTRVAAADGVQPPDSAMAHRYKLMKTALKLSATG